MSNSWKMKDKTMKDSLIDLTFIIFGIFGSWWLLLLIILSS